MSATLTTCPFPHCPLPEEHDGPHLLPATVTVGPETAANIRAGHVGGMSITEPSLPAPVAASEHVMFHQSTRFPGVVWPL